MKLGQIQRAIALIKEGLATDAEAPELHQLSREAERSLQELAMAKQQEAAKAMTERAPAKQLASELLRRQYKIGHPQLSLGILSLIQASPRKLLKLAALKDF
jgi:hypothetical protein